MMRSRLFFISVFLQLSAIAMAQQVYNVIDFGAKGNGKVLDSNAIQKAIDQCYKDGGGTVLVPVGTYLSATIQ
ncbi:MAG: glycoside hydrolase family 28 protein, partial [Prevotella sp.]|nr:glycoside hydrolase family 28 protein [Prevotella sp.]